jgi:hypothetical protein
MHRSKDELDSYDYFLMREQDERGRVEFAEKRMEEKTKKANTLEIAKKFKLAGIDNNTIANSTGLSIEEIDKL